MCGIVTISATPEQLFEGSTVGSRGNVACTGCQQVVRDGNRVGIYAHQIGDDTQWDIVRLFCVDCREESIQYPMTGVTEVMLHACLAVTSNAATQSVRLTLHGVDTMHLSTSEDGGDR